MLLLLLCDWKAVWQMSGVGGKSGDEATEEGDDADRVAVPLVPIRLRPLLARAWLCWN